PGRRWRCGAPPRAVAPVGRDKRAPPPRRHSLGLADQPPRRREAIIEGIDVRRRPLLVTAELSVFLAPQRLGAGEFADEEGNRRLLLQRAGRGGVDPLEVLVEPAQALVAVVEARQRPGRLGVV